MSSVQTAEPLQGSGPPITRQGRPTWGKESVFQASRLACCEPTAGAMMRKRANILATRGAADCESPELQQPPGTSRHLRRLRHSVACLCPGQGRELRASPRGHGSISHGGGPPRVVAHNRGFGPIAHAASPPWRWPPAASAASSHIPPSSPNARRAGTAATCHWLWARKNPVGA